ncbi:MAG: DUF3667 domain-containing protein [Flavobacteriaceae bacterium]|nr:DUF3667 domain-containing protein [Flavobacteriaceae bacterium]
MIECKNCHTPFSDETDFCPSCGGKVIRNRLTLKALFAHFSEQFLNYDNKFLKTFLHLFTKPEEVIDSYINGTRKKYVNVISYFAIAITVSGLQMFILNKFFPELIDFSSIDDIRMRNMQQKNMRFVSEYQGLIMMLSVPFYALMSKITFFNIKKYNYTEHLVIFMFISAQITIIGVIIMLSFTIIGVSLMTVTVIISPLYIIYSTYALKRLYKFDFGEIILRTFLFIFVASIIFIALTIIFYAGFYFIDPEGFIEFMDAQTQKGLQKN